MVATTVNPKKHEEHTELSDVDEKTSMRGPLMTKI